MRHPKIIPSALLLFALFSFLCTTVLAEQLANLEKQTELLIAYFRFHGVHSIVLTVCAMDIANTQQQVKFNKVVGAFMAHNFYIKISKGDVHVEEPMRQKFGPPRTFKENNLTRHYIDFQLPPLTHKTGNVLLKMHSACALNVLSWAAAGENNFFKTNHFWLLYTETERNIELLSDDTIFIPPCSEVRVWHYKEENSTISLLDVYKTAADKPLRKRLIGENQDSVQSLLQSLQNYGSAISYREDLEGLSFNTGLVIAFPDLFTNIEDLSMRHIDTISKVNNRLMIELGNKLNMRYNTHQMDNYGWHQPNGSFDGLMGRFQRYELDFGQMAIFMRLDRIALVDFVAETFRIRAGIMFRQPPLSAVSNIFALPFEKDVWVSILLLIIFTVVVFYFELLFSPHVHDMDLLDCFIFVWGAMCQQGFSVSMYNRSARIIIFTTFVATLFLFTSFSANIVALLQSPSEAIASLSDLSESPLEIGVQDTVYNKIYFNESTDPVTNNLYHRKIAGKGEKIYMRPLIGMAKMRANLFAYQVELQAGYQIISDTFSEPEKCGLKELEPFQLPMIAIPTRKNFPYKELFRRQLRWQREVGLMNREELKWFPQKPKCESGFGGFVSIGLTECRYALAIFGYGVLVALGTLVLEVLFKRLLKRFYNTVPRNFEHKFML